MFTLRYFRQITVNNQKEQSKRRRGLKIKARGICCDSVRSNHSYFVKASGLRCFCTMPLVPVPWAQCVWTLPFLTMPTFSDALAIVRQTL